MAFSDRELLARLIECEAGGEGEEGMKAVASVVINRVNASGGEYARVGRGNIRNIILQPGQFVCAETFENGMPNPQNIYNMSPTVENYEIADWALGGGTLSAVGDCLWYFNPFSSNCEQYFPRNGSGIFHTRINQHCFYRPTSLYWET